MVNAEVDQIVGCEATVSGLGQILNLIGIDIENPEAHEMIGVDPLKPKLARYPSTLVAFAWFLIES